MHSEVPSPGQARVRDAVSLAPLYAYPTPSPSQSARSRSRLGQQIGHLRRTNQALVGLKELDRGHLTDAVLATEVWAESEQSFPRAPVLGRSFSSRIRKAESDRPPPPGRPVADDAVTRLLGERASMGLPPSRAGIATNRVPLRGEMHRMVPENVDVPGPGNRAVDV